MMPVTKEAPREGRRVREGRRRDRAADIRGASVLVPRGRLMRQLAEAGEEAGTVFLCAPFGFGKTAALLELVMQARSDGATAARIIDAQGLTAAEFVQQIDAAADELDPAERQLVAVDNVPNYGKERCARVADDLRRLRAAGCRVVLSCTPSTDALMASMGDAAKIGAQSFKVQTREYADWARELAISPQVDMYGYTQGVPAFVAALRGMTERPQDSTALDREVAAVYREAVMGRASGARRLMRAMVLARSGTFDMLRSGGVRASDSDVRRIRRGWPLFGLDGGGGGFSCVRMRDGTYEQLARLVAAQEPALAARVARALMLAGRTDDAMWIAVNVLDRPEAGALIARFPLQACLDGHAAEVRAVYDDLDAVRRHAGARLRPDGAEPGPPADLGLVLGAYAASLITGDLRVARALSFSLAARADAVAREVSPDDWDAARACCELWGAAGDAGLPQVEFAEPGEPSARTVQLRLHVRMREALFDGAASQALPDLREHALEDGSAVDLPALLVRLDLMMADAFAGAAAEHEPDLARLDELAQLMERRKMLGPAAFTRLAAAVCAMVGRGAARDDAVFSEATAAAVRAADVPFQLLAMTAHGWNDLLRDQVVSAQFRAQQVLRLSAGRRTPLADWAGLLGAVAQVRSSSLMALRAEADACDLDEQGADAFTAWRVALVLSAVRSDAELAAWFSRYRRALLAPKMAALGRLAVRCAGEAASALRRLLPASFAGDAAPLPAAPPALVPDRDLGLGQVRLRLFGGFSAEKNGHVLVSQAWRRRRAESLAARLALCPGAYVERAVIAREMWPESDYKHARENLYMTLSSLRRAFGQVAGGPTYVVAQGDGVALNPEFVTTDVAAFNALARDVLLRRDDLPAPRLVESCLKLEELYAGPLYQPTRGATDFFDRARAALRAKFLDCMVAGASAALAEGQLPVASWLAQAALAQGPYREDAVRCALRVFARQGRRAEAVALFEEHARQLACATGSAPERETCAVYEEVLSGAIAAPAR